MHRWAGSGDRSLAGGLWPICEGYSVRWNARTAGNWPNKLATATPDGVQRLLYNYRWDANQVRDDLRDYVVEHLGDADPE